MKFGEKLKTLRREKKLSQKALADLAGITTRTIQNYETNEILPKKRDTYNRLARALAVDVTDLMSENEDFVLSAGGCRGNWCASTIPVTHLSWHGDWGSSSNSALTLSNNAGLPR